jgi:hypothetical protein
MWKVGQIGALATGLYIANATQNKEAWDSIPANEKVTNWIITTPLTYQDKEGNKRYFYFRIAKDQGQRVFASIFEGLMAGAMGHSIDTDQIVGSIGDFLPIVPNEKLPPAFSAMLGYLANKDFWRLKDVWRGPKDIKPEQEFTPFTHPALVKAGEYTGLSPERLGYALGQFAPPSNTYIGLMNTGLKEIMGGLPKDKREKDMGEIVNSIPMANKLMRSTDPYEPQRKLIEDAKIEATTKRYIQNRDMMNLVDENIKKPQKEKFKAYREFQQSQPKDDADHIFQTIKRYEAYHEIPDRRWWLALSHMTPESRALVWYAKYKDSTPADQVQMKKYTKLPGIASERFMGKVGQLMREGKR